MVRKKARPKAKTKKAARKPVRRTARKAAKKAPKKSRKAAVNPEKVVERGLFVGEVEDFFAHVGVVAITLQKPLAVGDTVRIKGHTTDLTQKIETLQIDHEFVQAASAKDAVGIKIVDRARKGDAVYKL